MRWRNHRWLKHIPTQETVLAYPFLKPVRHILDHHGLWQFNRRSVAWGAAIGLFFSVAIPIAQIPVAAMVAVYFRVNVPVAIFGTLLSNPFTTPAILFFAYQLGSLMVGHAQPAQAAVAAQLAKPDDEAGFIRDALNWIMYWIEWTQSAGWPLVIGLALLAVLLAVVGYVGVRVLWRLQAALRWKKRRLDRMAD
ncbi:DUF2062 domain-containing protein [Oxalobacteraceae bacterium R-40]|uniref:DUF2062 domain-containing protein n=1 Tax=Keguizhuia sedimenti TaxID=3064264 RepID=A0ABU1BJF5_9BURK|nr:DUF2062 domain-containing protein [Oxalobacteraceae bacterium R-40]